MSSKPTIVLVPGSFSNSAFYAPLADALRAANHNLHILDPPCYYNKKPGPLPTMYDDAAFISAFITPLADAGEEIVLLAHSYGGTPTSQSLKGITRGERAEKGLKGGVVRVGYVTSVVPREGETAMEAMPSEEPSPLEVQEDGWLAHLSPEIGPPWIFNSLPLAEAQVHAAKFGQHSSAAFGVPLTHAGYADVPVSYFFCTDDKCVTPEMQQRGIDGIEASWEKGARKGKKVDVTKVDCDHVPIFSALEELVKWVEGVVELGGKESA